MRIFRFLYRVFPTLIVSFSNLTRSPSCVVEVDGDILRLDLKSCADVLLDSSISPSVIRLPYDHVVWVLHSPQEESLLVNMELNRCRGTLLSLRSGRAGCSVVESPSRSKRAPVPAPSSQQQNHQRTPLPSHPSAGELAQAMEEMRADARSHSDDVVGAPALKRVCTGGVEGGNASTNVAAAGPLSGGAVLAPGVAAADATSTLERPVKLEEVVPANENDRECTAVLDEMESVVNRAKSAELSLIGALHALAGAVRTYAIYRFAVMLTCVLRL